MDTGIVEVVSRPDKKMQPFGLAAMLPVDGLDGLHLFEASDTKPHMLLAHEIYGYVRDVPNSEEFPAYALRVAYGQDAFDLYRLYYLYINGLERTSLEPIPRNPRVGDRFALPRRFPHNQLNDALAEYQDYLRNPESYR